MTDGKSIIQERLQPVSIKPDEAFEVFRKMDEPSIIGCHRLLEAQGHKISSAWLATWCAKYDWFRRVGKPTETMSAKAMLAKIKEEGEFLTPEIARGIENRVAMRLAHLVNKIKIDGTKDMVTLVEVMERLRALQREDGANATAKARKGAAEPAGLGLVDLKAFKVNK